jgi:hypothetical protein
MERSEIRGGISFVPGFRFAPSGLQDYGFNFHVWTAAADQGVFGVLNEGAVVE